MNETVADTLRQAWQNFLVGCSLVLPRVIAMMSIILAGLFIAFLARAVTRRFMRWRRIESLFDRAGARGLLERAELPTLDMLVGSVVFWLVLFAFLLAGVTALGISGMDQLVTDVFSFIPRLLLAVLILAVGALAANFAWRSTLLASVNAQLPFPRLLSGIVRALIWTFAAAMALEQIGIGRTIVVAAFVITFGAAMLALAIAVGVGGGGVARKIFERQFSPEDQKGPDTEAGPHL